MANYRLDVSTSRRGVTAVSYQGELIADCECAAARWLIANAHAAEGDTMTTWRGGMPCLSGRVGWFSVRTVRENKNSGPTYARWIPFPTTAVAPGQTLSAAQ
jgi:hypothetical protein